MKLTKLTEQDDIEAYIITFERMMAVYEVPCARWTYKLAPELTGKSQQAYVAMPADQAGDYGELEAAILRRYNINEETSTKRPIGNVSERRNTGTEKHLGSWPPN